MGAGAYLEITLVINESDRGHAAKVYEKYKGPFLSSIPGAKSKDLLVRNEDVQVLHGFGTIQEAQDYLKSPLFTNDVVTALKPYLKKDPDVRTYKVV
jgi:hypothetical protein